MAKKPKSMYLCSDCGYSSAKWLGRCPDCGSWGTLEESTTSTISPTTTTLTPHSPAQPITTINAADATYIPTGISELDRVLGSGIVAGSVVLLAGEPGVGKSTLLLEVASRWAQQTTNNKQRIALYITAEESAGQVRMRAQRTGALQNTLYLAAESNLDILFGHVEQLKPSLLIVDSVQTIHAPGVEGVAGGVAQSRAVTAALTSLAKTSNIPVLLVGHVTKDGNVAGPRVLEHLVDVVLHFEGDRHSSLRMLRSIKNRFGATDEVGCFEQRSNGIKEVPDPSGLFLSHRDTTPDGTAVTVAMDGVRPLLAEVQALVVPTEAKNPRRAVTGLDSTRVPMVLAVLSARAGKRTHNTEVYVATVGGMKIGEPATDLAVALATASAMSKKPLPAQTVVVGEVGLAGEIRRVPNLARRLQEAARLGYTRAIVPVNNENINNIEIIQVRDITEALAQLR
ncbi:DNA repair protein RadA [Corynebacterium kutscheri]|uniref:DNA repair protein RadA n=1 Tax=Corynebacterium kutscheri TaxID=35755 RepID=A0A0F6R106_9CORY|nr:DNA repair protein RadA [Corynebacterium kutscheri]AKE40753.1 DNA repair protein RadA [Corynebacterium kutscheri]VEH11151.1 DNA repair protein RadA [Corynebacterium kutscheri]VEH80372.1 DNA repair protein RadA [Corynebacterium kutscheri]